MQNTTKLQFMSLIGGMTFYTPIFTLLLLQRDIGLDFIVAAQTLFTVGMLISTIPTGILADKWGQKRAIQIGMLLDMASMLSLLFIHTPTALLVFFLVRGIGISFRDGADEALFYDSYVEENGSGNGYSKAFGKLMSNDTLGFVIATAVAGVAAQFFGSAAYLPLVLLTAIATLVSLILAFTLRTSKKHIKESEASKLIQQLKSGFSIVKNSKVLIALTAFGLLTMNGEYFLRQTYQPLFEELSVPALFLGIALSAGKLLNYFAVKNAHRLEKYFTVDKILLWLTLILGAGFILLAVANSAWTIVAAFMLIQTLLNSQQPVISDLVNEQITPAQRSTTLSTISFIKSIGQVGSRLLLGVSIGLVGLGDTFIVQGVYLIIGGIVGVWYLRRCGCINRVKHTQSTAHLATTSS